MRRDHDTPVQTRAQCNHSKTPYPRRRNPSRSSGPGRRDFSGRPTPRDRSSVPPMLSSGGGAKIWVAHAHSCPVNPGSLGPGGPGYRVPRELPSTTGPRRRGPFLGDGDRRRDAGQHVGRLVRVSSLRSPGAHERIIRGQADEPSSAGQRGLGGQSIALDSA